MLVSNSSPLYWLGTYLAKYLCVPVGFGGGVIKAKLKDFKFCRNVIQIFTLWVVQ
jgi:hypothetical protein